MQRKAASVSGFYCIVGNYGIVLLLPAGGLFFVANAGYRIVSDATLAGLTNAIFRF
jgi:hypothetical protein